MPIREGVQNAREIPSAHGAARPARPFWLPVFAEPVAASEGAQAVRERVGAELVAELDGFRPSFNCGLLKKHNLEAA